ncbi:MAG: SusC/RagA family TonB-linked outer membrane protein [Bacteroidales bacterium]
MYVKTQIRRLVFLVCALSVIAIIPMRAQTAKVTLDSKNVKLETVLNQIEKQSTYLFVYGNSVNPDTLVTIKSENQELSEVLHKLLDNLGYSYSVNKSSIVLSKNASSQQNVKIKGQVLDENGETLIGAYVIIEGTDLASVTDIDGAFEMTIPVINKNTELTVSYIGYNNQKILLGNRTNFIIKMEPNSSSLDEVVVTALGIKRSTKALTYNVQQLKGEDLLVNKDANFINSLNGKVAGVTINSTSSGVGGAAKVVMRGSKSIAQSSNALYVIDGVPMYNGTNIDSDGMGYASQGATDGIADVNPEDISTISVLTGAAAAALYGSEASNGAIVITTKRGQVGKTTLTVTSNTQFMSPFVLPEFQNTYGTGDLLSKVDVVDRSWGAKLNDANYRGYTPEDDFYQQGVVGTEGVSLSTGNAKNQTYISALAVNSKGIVPNNQYNRYNFTARNTTSFLDDKLQLDFGASFIKQNDRNMVNQGIYSNPIVPAYLFPRGDDWNDIKMYERYDDTRGIYTQYWPQELSEFTGQNPYWITNRNLRTNTRDRYMLNASLKYVVSDWLNVSGRIKVDNTSSTFEKKLYATTNQTLSEGSENGLYGVSKINEYSTYGDILANIDKDLGADYYLKINLGASFNSIKFDKMENQGPIMSNGLPNVFNIFQLDDTKIKRSQEGYREQTQSVFANAEISWRKTLFLNFSARNDWPSQLAGPQSQTSSFFYPSVGGSVIVSELINMPKEIEYLKFRTSYASVGLPFPRFLANPKYAWDSNDKVWVTKTTYPLYNLKPERTNSFEAGLTMNFLKYFNLDFSYYLTHSKNQTFNPNISVSSGYSDLYVQTGDVRNTGIEMLLGFKKNWGDFRWNITYTLSANKNKIISLVKDYENPETGAIINKSTLDIGGYADARFILKEGGSLGDMYSLSDLKRDSNGDIYVDANNEISKTKLNSDDAIKMGSVFPKSNMSINNDFSYKNINLGFQLSGRFGGIVFSETQAVLDRYGVSKASAVARDNGGVIINGGDLINAENYYSVIGTGMPLFYTYSATNIRLAEAHIGYTIPKAKLWDLFDMKVSLEGHNLLMLYKKAPFDPESVASTSNYYQGIDNFMMPSTRNIGFNIKLTF